MAKFEKYTNTTVIQKAFWINVKCKFMKVIDSHCVELDIPSRIWPRFHVDLLEGVATDPLPSLTVDDLQPQTLQTDDDKKDKTQDEKQDDKKNDNTQYVDRILRAETRKIEGGKKAFPAGQVDRICRTDMGAERKS